MLPENTPLSFDEILEIIKKSSDFIPEQPNAGSHNPNLKVLDCDLAEVPKKLLGLGAQQESELALPIIQRMGIENGRSMQRFISCCSETLLSKEEPIFYTIKNISSID